MKIGDLAKPDISRDLVFFDVGAKILLVFHLFNEKDWVILANKELKIRNIDSGLLGWLSRLAKEKNISRNELILETLELLYTLESCQKLYEEQSHQQAQNTKKIKEIASK